jgi:hypothetical protein
MITYKQPGKNKMFFTTYDNAYAYLHTNVPISVWHRMTIRKSTIIEKIFKV